MRTITLFMILVIYWREGCSVGRSLDGEALEPKSSVNASRTVVAQIIPFKSNFSGALVIHLLHTYSKGYSAPNWGYDLL